MAFSGCRHAVAAGESQRVNALKHLSIRARRTQTITHTIQEIPQVGAAVISTQNSRNPQARRRATIQQLLQRVQGTRTGKDPQLITHIVIETRPRVSVRRAKSLRVVLSHRRRHRNTVTVMNQTSRKLEVIIPNKELSNRQTTITANSLRIHQNRHERGATNRTGTHRLRTSMTLLTRRKHRARSVHRVVFAVRPHHTRGHHRGALRRHRRIVQPGGNRLRQSVLGRLGVIIHNPHQVRVMALQGAVNTHRETASAAHIALQADAIHRQLIVQGAQILGSTVRGGVINNHYRRRHTLTRSDTRKGLRQQVLTVISHHHGDRAGILVQRIVRRRLFGRRLGKSGHVAVLFCHKFSLRGAMRLNQPVRDIPIPSWALLVFLAPAAFNRVDISLKENILPAVSTRE